MDEHIPQPQTHEAVWWVWLATQGREALSSEAVEQWL
jgi:hypothetical protein